MSQAKWEMINGVKYPVSPPSDPSSSDLTLPRTIMYGNKEYIVVKEISLAEALKIRADKAKAKEKQISEANLDSHINTPISPVPVSRYYQKQWLNFTSRTHLPEDMKDAFVPERVTEVQEEETMYTRRRKNRRMRGSKT